MAAANRNPSPIIQIAGLHDLAEAEAVAAAGATHLGFPLRLAVHQEDLSEEAARAIIARLRSRAVCMLITYLDRAGEIAALCRFLGVHGVQLHGPVAVEETARLRRMAPELVIFKSLIVGQAPPEALMKEAAVFAPWIDALITDTFDPASGATGATGKPHDWEVSRLLAQRSASPLILAGGLTPENVAAAITVVHPAGVDAHTGVEGADGRKDPALVRRFVAEARAALPG